MWVGVGVGVDLQGDQFPGLIMLVGQDILDVMMDGKDGAVVRVDPVGVAFEFRPGPSLGPPRQHFNDLIDWPG